MTTEVTTEVTMTTITTLASLESTEKKLKVVQQLMAEGYDGLTIDNVETRLKAVVAHYKNKK